MRHGLWLLLSFTLMAPLRAENTPPAPADAKVLDFIADWQGADGQWVDPMTFARIDPAKVKAEDARRHGKSPAPASPSKDAPAAGTGVSRAAR
jgi:hypothetical protein